MVSATIEVNRPISIHLRGSDAAPQPKKLPSRYLALISQNRQPGPSEESKRLRHKGPNSTQLKPEKRPQLKFDFGGIDAIHFSGCHEHPDLAFPLVLWQDSLRAIPIQLR
jgi:hypothetical protein